VNVELTRLHHIGIVADDIEQAAATIGQLYGIAVTLFSEVPYSCLVEGKPHDTVQRMGLSAGPPHIELIRTVAGSPVWKPAPGIHHLGFVVDDLVTASAQLEAHGAPLWMAGARDGCAPRGAVYHRDSLGLVVELLDRPTAQRLTDRAPAAIAETSAAPH
jgi:methylmalonyl-CoA/ethylmalonyl-CoA epimerase